MDKASRSKLGFDKQAEAWQIAWRKKERVARGERGTQNRVERDHILPNRLWHLGLWEPIRDELKHYLRVNGIQSHTGRHNLKSSWTQGANTFFPFRSTRGMAPILTDFLSEQLGLTITSIEGMELEYAAPGNLEPKRILGEAGGGRGAGQTSPDVAVLFGCRDGKSGIYLIENKYTEHSFYDCSAAKKTLGKEYSDRGLTPNPDSGRCKDIEKLLGDPENACQQQTWGRRYWSLLTKRVNRKAVTRCGRCPAMHGGYQLFRQQALAQGIADSRLFDYVVSGVAYDARNEALKTCLKGLGIENFTTGWSGLFRTKVKFHCFTHQDLVSYGRKSRAGQQWADYMSERYGYE